MSYSEDKNALNVANKQSTIGKSSQQSSMTKTFLSSNPPSYMQHTQSSMVKERQIQEDVAQDIMKKNVEAKNKKAAAQPIRSNQSSVIPEGTPQKPKMLSNLVHQYADESDGDKYINIDDTQPMFS